MKQLLQPTQYSDCLVHVVLAVILITHLVVMTLLVYRFEGCGINIIFSFILQSLGAVLYFIGDNLSKLVNRYNKSLKIAEIAGTVCIAIALVFFLFVPQISHLLFDAKKMCVKTKKPVPKTEIILVKPANDEYYEQASKDKKFDDKLWCTAIDTITLILKVEVLYSAVMAMTTASENVCSERDKYLSILCSYGARLRTDYHRQCCLTSEKRSSLHVQMWHESGLCTNCSFFFFFYTILHNVHGYNHSRASTKMYPTQEQNELKRV